MYNRRRTYIMQKEMGGQSLLKKNKNDMSLISNKIKMSLMLHDHNYVKIFQDGVHILNNCCLTWLEMC